MLDFHQFTILPAYLRLGQPLSPTVADPIISLEAPPTSAGALTMPPDAMGGDARHSSAQNGAQGNLPIMWTMEEGVRSGPHMSLDLCRVCFGGSKYGFKV